MNAAPARPPVAVTPIYPLPNFVCGGINIHFIMVSGKHFNNTVVFNAAIALGTAPLDSPVDTVMS